jgi:hypothetical protein
MSLLLENIKKICKEEGLDFNQFIERIKNPPKRAQQGDLFGGRDK